MLLRWVWKKCIPFRSKELLIPGPLLFFLCTFTPTLVCTLFSLFFLEGSQKSQLVLVVFASFLLCGSALKLLLNQLEGNVQIVASSKTRQEFKQLEDAAELTHQQEIERYKEKIKEGEESSIEMQKAYEQKIQLLQNSFDQALQEIETMNLHMEKKREEIRLAYLEFEDGRKEIARLEESLQIMRKEAEERVARKENLLNEYQHTIYEQRGVLEKKQQYIGKLEGKVHDLMYEIRALLQLEEPPSDPQIQLDLNLQDAQSVSNYYLPTHEGQMHKNFDVATQLERYMKLAQEYMGVGHLAYRGGKSPRFLDLAHSSYEIDLRSLFEHFKDETIGIIFFFSPQERRFLFVNNYVKTLLGHSPEKFMYKFAELVESGYSYWLEALGKIREGEPVRTRLVMLTKEGLKKQLTCQMGMLSHGPFKGHIIGILAS